MVVSNQSDLALTERWISSFSMSLSRGQDLQNSNEGDYYPGRFLRGKRYKHLVLFNKMMPSGKENKLIIQWVLNEDYRGNSKNNAIEIAFVLNQILGRRGAGSLYLFLSRNGWIQNTTTIPLQVKVPINV